MLAASKQYDAPKSIMPVGSGIAVTLRTKLSVPKISPSISGFGDGLVANTKSVNDLFKVVAVVVPKEFPVKVNVPKVIEVGNQTARGPRWQR